jgi:hypothetical protein
MFFQEHFVTSCGFLLLLLLSLISIAKKYYIHDREHLTYGNGTFQSSDEPPGIALNV